MSEVPVVYDVLEGTVGGDINVMFKFTFTCFCGIDFSSKPKLKRHVFGATDRLMSCKGESALRSGLMEEKTIKEPLFEAYFSPPTGVQYHFAWN